MKTFITLTALLGLLVSGKANTKPVAPDSNICLELSGKVNHLSHKADDSYKAELIYYNTVVDSVIVKDNKPFKFNFKKNAYYAIRISKKGYVTRLISVHTHLTKDKDGFYRMHFDTELIEEADSNGLDAETLDFPIAIISFDKKLGWFYYNEEYTGNIKRALYSAKVKEHHIASKH